MDFRNELFRWDDIQREHVRAGVERAAFGGEGVICVFNWVSPGNDVRPHQHDFEQLALILEGECTYEVGGVVHRCGPGSMVRIPPLTMHHIEVTGDRTVLNLDVFAPVREDLGHLLDHQTKA